MRRLAVGHVGHHEHHLGVLEEAVGEFVERSLTSSMLISLPTISQGTCGKTRWSRRRASVSTVASPMPASAACNPLPGAMRPSSAPIRAATTGFSLVAVLNRR